uniref:Uncharacterized protein n=1 Tax=Glossina pallidipes TaxID=7398 RepID=A0A1A9ZS08_GLOPL
MRRFSTQTLSFFVRSKNKNQNDHLQVCFERHTPKDSCTNRRTNQADIEVVLTNASITKYLKGKKKKREIFDFALNRFLLVKDAAEHDMGMFSTNNKLFIAHSLTEIKRKDNTVSNLFTGLMGCWSVMQTSKSSSSFRGRFSITYLAGDFLGGGGNPGFSNGSDIIDHTERSIKVIYGIFDLINCSSVLGFTVERTDVKIVVRSTVGEESVVIASNAIASCDLKAVVALDEVLMDSVKLGPRARNSSVSSSIILVFLVVGELSKNACVDRVESTIIFDAVEAIVFCGDFVVFVVVAAVVKALVVAMVAVVAVVAVAAAGTEAAVLVIVLGALVIVAEGIVEVGKALLMLKPAVKGKVDILASYSVIGSKVIFENTVGVVCLTVSFRFEVLLGLNSAVGVLAIVLYQRLKLTPPLMLYLNLARLLSTADKVEVDATFTGVAVTVVGSCGNSLATDTSSNLGCSSLTEVMVKALGLRGGNFWPKYKYGCISSSSMDVVARVTAFIGDLRRLPRDLIPLPLFFSSGI